MFSNIFKNKSVLITGHTGFKGSWLTMWLHMLGAKIIAISKDIPTKPSHFEHFEDITSLDKRFDLCNIDKLQEVISDERPDFVFHLAAQPLVLESYKNPYTTYCSNAFATLNILECLKKSNHESIVVMITSDKCYENTNQVVNYNEDDRLGGIDPYSTSKASAELIIKGYCESFFKTSKSNIKVCSARAGNVMGGGDWAKDRIVPDLVKSWKMNKVLSIRNSKATRPWQHVLEPIGGYLTLASLMSNNLELNGESFNFGPSGSHSHTVEELVIEISHNLPESKWEIITEKNQPYEANLLALDCSKAKNKLNWESKLNFQQTAEWTGKWYHTYYSKGPKEAINLTKKQIIDYEKY